VPCRQASTGAQCLLECVGIGSFDLTPLIQDAAYQLQGYHEAKDEAGHTYFFNPCGQLSSAIECASSSVKSPAVIQSSKPTLPLSGDQCTALGEETSAVCQVRTGAHLTCTYVGGDGGRSVEIHYACAHAPTAAFEAYELSLGKYSIWVRGSSGCVATNKRDRSSNATSSTSGNGIFGYFEDQLGLDGTVSWWEVAKRLEGLAPGVIAAIAVLSSLCLCCSLLLLCYVRFKMRQLRMEYEERLRLTSAKVEIDAFDEHSGGGGEPQWDSIELANELASTQYAGGGPDPNSQARAASTSGTRRKGKTQAKVEDADL